MKETPEWVRIYEALKQAKEALEEALPVVRNHSQIRFYSLEIQIENAIEQIKNFGIGGTI